MIVLIALFYQIIDLRFNFNYNLCMCIYIACYLLLRSILAD